MCAGAQLGVSATDVGSMLLRESKDFGGEARPHIVCSALTNARAAGACSAACGA